MKRILTLALAAACLAIGAGARADDYVAPATLSITNFRGVATGTAASESEFFMGSSLLLTNCVCYSGADTNSAVQGLDGVTLELTLRPTAITSTVVSASALVASNGTWYATATIPVAEGGDTSWCWIQLKLTDATTNTYIYPWQKIITRKAL